MRRIGVVAVCLLLGLAAVSVAEEMDVGARAGYGRVGESDSGGMMLGLFGRRSWGRTVFFEGAVFYHSEKTGGVDVEIIPLQLSVMLFLLGRDDQFSPYVDAGIGGYITRVSNGGDSDSDVDFGWHLGIGLDYALSDRMFVELDTRYAWLDSEFEGRTIADTLSDTETWSLTVGLGFRL